MAIEDFTDRVKPQFWTNSNRAPKAQFRFRVVIPGLGLEDARNEQGDAPGGDDFKDKQSVGLTGADIWYVKSCDKPGMDLPDPLKDTSQTGFIRSRPRPAVTTPTFTPITMVLIDPYYPNVTRKIARLFRRGGLNDQQARDAIQPMGTINDFAAEFLDSIGPVQIYQLDEKGNDIERWTLHGAYPDQVNFGKFDYSSNDPVEITLTWYYSAFSVEFPKIGNEQDFEYFPDAKLIGQDLAALAKAPSTTQATNVCLDNYNKATSGLKALGILTQTFEEYKNIYCRDLLGIATSADPLPSAKPATPATQPGATSDESGDTVLTAQEEAEGLVEIIGDPDSIYKDQPISDP